MADPADPAAPPLPDHAEAESDRSLYDELRDLAGDTRTALEAEAAYQSARARLAGRELRQIALWSAIAVMFGFVALLTLAIGAVIALDPLIGGVAATLIVVFFLAISGAVAAIVAYQGVRGLKRITSGRDPGDRA